MSEVDWTWGLLAAWCWDRLEQILLGVNILLGLSYIYSFEHFVTVYSEFLAMTLVFW